MNQPTNLTLVTPAASTGAAAQPTTLDDLAAAHLQAKAELDAARARLDAINNQIIKTVGTKDEGSFSVEGDEFKITTRQDIRRSVDPKLAQDVYRSLPRDIADAIFDWKPSLNLKLFRELAKYQADTHALISTAVTSKPSKPSVSVKPIDRPEAA